MKGADGLLRMLKVALDSPCVRKFPVPFACHDYFTPSDGGRGRRSFGDAVYLTRLAMTALVVCRTSLMVAEIHDGMPVILPASAHDRWLACIEPDPRDVLVPYPPNLMTIWPISTRVNKPDNDGMCQDLPFSRW